MVPNTFKMSAMSASSKSKKTKLYRFSSSYHRNLQKLNKANPLNEFQSDTVQLKNESSKQVETPQNEDSISTLQSLMYEVPLVESENSTIQDVSDISNDESDK